MTAMWGRGRGEHRRRFAGQRSRQPQPAGGIQKVFERRRHVAKAPLPDGVATLARAAVDRVQ